MQARRNHVPGQRPAATVSMAAWVHSWYGFICSGSRCEQPGNNQGIPGILILQLMLVKVVNWDM